MFSPDAEAPFRIEFLGDQIESIRQFSPESQRSLGDLQAVEITAQYSPLSPLGGRAGGEAARIVGPVPGVAAAGVSTMQVSGWPTGPTVSQRMPP